MRRRARPVVEVPPEELWRFRMPDWAPLTGHDAYRAYREAREAWAAERGLSMGEFRELVPAPVVALETRRRPRRAP